MILVSKNVRYMRMTDACSLRIGRQRQIGHEDSIFVILCLLTYDVIQSAAPPHQCAVHCRCHRLTARVSLRLHGVHARPTQHADAME